jgi:hypothetical protein
MRTKFYDRQVAVYPLVTRELLKNTRPVSPSHAAKHLMSGLSMNQFLIPVSHSQSIHSTLYCQFALAYNLIFFPIAVIMKMYEDMRFQD